jgi:pimeloyl-ACP methyl ester carboxylesterase
MLTIISLIFWMAVSAGVLALFGFCCRSFLQIDRHPDAIHFVRTEDGWRLGLAHYRPLRAIPGAPPIVLCPGLGFSGALYDLSEETSLARFLTVHGYEAWVLDWRGRGLSEKPRLGGHRRYNWSFDDYVDFDAPAVLEHVCRQSGAARVHWIGLGSGALVAWGVLSGPAAQRIASVISLGAPCYFRRQGGLVSPWLLWLWGLLRVEAVMGIFSPLLGRTYPGPLSLLQNRDNIEPALYRRALVHAACSPSAKEIQQQRAWWQQDVFSAIDKQRDYRKALSAVETPSFFLSGPRDPFAPAEMVEASLQALAEIEEKVFVLASRMHGMSTNYGHLDLLLGRNARRDVYPHLLKWLDLHAEVPVPAERPEPPVQEEAAPRRERNNTSLAHLPSAIASPPRPLNAPPFDAAQEEAPLTQEERPVHEDEEDLEWGAEGDVPHVPSPR